MSKLIDMGQLGKIHQVNFAAHQEGFSRRGGRIECEFTQVCGIQEFLAELFANVLDFAKQGFLDLSHIPSGKATVEKVCGGLKLCGGELSWGLNDLVLNLLLS